MGHKLTAVNFILSTSVMEFHCNSIAKIIELKNKPQFHSRIRNMYNAILQDFR